MVVEAHWVSERRGHERLASEQPPYSMLVRGIETDLLQVCRHYGMGVLSWSPLAGGWLSGRFGTGQENTSRRAERLPGRYDLSLPGNAAKLTAVDQLSALAAKAGHSLPELAVAFVLAHPAVTSTIIGPRTMGQLTSLLGAGDVRLSHDVLDGIDEVVAPGQDLNAIDHGWVPPWVEHAHQRRRG
jgi:aryl-alcohol dehydrogenase-like predicted oxidoreductase